MATQVERLPAKRVPTKAWIGIGAAIVLLMALGGGMLIGRATVEEPAPPPEPMAPAPDKFVATIDANIAALNAGDEDAYVATWGEGGEFSGWGGLGFVSFESYWERRSADPAAQTGTRIERTSHVIFAPRLFRAAAPGPYAAHTFYCGEGEFSYPGIAVYQFGEGLKIVRQWVMSPGRKWAPVCY